VQRRYRYARDYKAGYIAKGSKREWREQRRLSIVRTPTAARALQHGMRERSRTNWEMNVIHALQASERGDDECCDDACFKRIVRGSRRGMGTLGYVLSFGLLFKQYGQHDEYEDELEKTLKNLKDHEETYEVGKSFKEVFAARRKKKQTGGKELV